MLMVTMLQETMRVNMTLMLPDLLDKLTMLLKLFFFLLGCYLPVSGGSFSLRS